MSGVLSHPPVMIILRSHPHRFAWAHLRLISIPPYQNNCRQKSPPLKAPSSLELCQRGEGRGLVNRPAPAQRSFGHYTASVCPKFHSRGSNPVCSLGFPARPRRSESIFDTKWQRHAALTGIHDKTHTRTARATYSKITERSSPFMVRRRRKCRSGV